MSHIHPLIEALDRIVKQEVEAYQQLLERQQAEKQLLVARQLDPFLDNLRSKEQLAGVITRLEQTRQKVATGLASHLRLAASDLTLRQISTLVEEPYASRFQTYRNRLQHLLRQLQQCNQENAQLLADSLMMINEALTFFACQGVENPTYQPSGDFSAPTQGRLFSERV